MSFCSDQILNLATTIYTDIGSPSAQSIGYISGVLTNSGSFIGAINNKLDTCFYLSGDAPCIVGFSTRESEIASLMYQVNYYNKARLAVLVNNGDTAWVTLKESDSTITRSNVVEIAKQYGALYADANQKLKDAVHYWTLNNSVVQGIDSAENYSWPTP